MWWNGDCMFGETKTGESVLRRLTGRSTVGYFELTYFSEILGSRKYPTPLSFLRINSIMFSEALGSDDSDEHASAEGYRFGQGAAKMVICRLHLMYSLVIRADMKMRR